MKRHRAISIATLIAISVAAGATAVALGGSDRARSTGSSARALAQMSNVGKQAVLGKRAQVQLAKSNLDGTVALLGSDGGRAFYRIDNTSNGTCFGVGPAAATASFGVISCPSGAFPTADKPVLDFSIIDIVRGSDQVRVWRAEGMAADGVATVGFVDTNGKTIATHPVVHNLYHFATPPSNTIGGLVAFDSNGTKIYSESYARG
jgi:hypothetical protein